MTSGSRLGRLTPDADAVSRLREALLANRFDPVALARPRQLRGLAGRNGATLDWAKFAEPDAALTALIELFVFGAPVKHVRAEAAMAPLTIADAQRAGFLEADGDHVSSPWEITPHDDLLLLGDHPNRLSDENPDFVVSESNAARTLAILTSRASVARALDMGTGSGIHALLAARHSGSVLAMDINPRATAIAGVNAHLNAIDNVDLRESDWFGRLDTAERFELVVANPPYIVSPEVHFPFAHTGNDPNALCRHLIQGSSARLAEGGLAQLQMSWTRRLADDSAEVLEQLLAGVGCDALVLPFESEDAVTYAVEECGWLAPRNPERFNELVGRWISHFHETGRDVIERGLVTLRRRSSGKPWLRRLHLARGPYKATGDQIRRIFDGNDYLEGLADERELLERTLLLPEGHHVHETYRHAPGGYELGPATLQLNPDVGFDGTVPADASAVMSSLNEAEALGATVTRVARESGIDEAYLRGVVIGCVRHLLSLGFIAPADLRDGS